MLLFCILFWLCWVGNRYEFPLSFVITKVTVCRIISIYIKISLNISITMWIKFEISFRIGEAKGSDSLADQFGTKWEKNGRKEITW